MKDKISTSEVANTSHSLVRIPRKVRPRESGDTVFQIEYRTPS